MFTEKEDKRIFSKIAKDNDSGCWNWIGTIDSGYGRISFRGSQIRTHRLLYMWKYGPLPKWENKQSEEVDHVCNNKRCCNPDHLRLVSSKVNTLRGVGPTAVNARKEYCIHGHDALYKTGNRRRCRECRRLFDQSEHRRNWKKARS